MDENIKIAGADFRLSTRMVDEVSWNLAYRKGYRPPSRQVPAIIYEIEWSSYQSYEFRSRRIRMWIWKYWNERRHYVMSRLEM